jgi:hypothetical protein
MSGAPWAVSRLLYPVPPRQVHGGDGAASEREAQAELDLALGEGGGEG